VLKTHTRVFVPCIYITRATNWAVWIESHHTLVENGGGQITSEAIYLVPVIGNQADRPAAFSALWHLGAVKGGQRVGSTDLRWSGGARVVKVVGSARSSSMPIAASGTEVPTPICNQPNHLHLNPHLQCNAPTLNPQPHPNQSTPHL